MIKLLHSFKFSCNSGRLWNRTPRAWPRCWRLRRWRLSSRWWRGGTGTASRKSWSKPSSLSSRTNFSSKIFSSGTVRSKLSQIYKYLGSCSTVRHRYLPSYYTVGPVPHLCNRKWKLEKLLIVDICAFWSGWWSWTPAGTRWCLGTWWRSCSPRQTNQRSRKLPVSSGMASPTFGDLLHISITCFYSGTVCLDQCFWSVSMEISIDLVSWIRIRIGKTDPYPGEQKMMPKNELNYKFWICKDLWPVFIGGCMLWCKPGGPY